MGLIDAADNAVVVVPLVPVHAVHVGDVVARDHAHQTIGAIPSQVHRAQRLVVLDAGLGQVRLFGRGVGRFPLLQTQRDGLLELAVLVLPGRCRRRDKQRRENGIRNVTNVLPARRTASLKMTEPPSLLLHDESQGPHRADLAPSEHGCCVEEGDCSGHNLWPRGRRRVLY